MAKRYRDADWLYQQYWENEHSLAEIGEKCDMSIGTIKRWMDKHGIERREPGHASPSDDDLRYKDVSYLRRRYHDYGWTQARIADECDVCIPTIRRWMEKFDIERREPKAVNDTRLHACDFRAAFAPKDAPWRQKDYLEQKYIEEGLLCRDIADLHEGVGHSTIRKEVKKHNLYRQQMVDTVETADEEYTVDWAKVSD